MPSIIHISNTPSIFAAHKTKMNTQRSFSLAYLCLALTLLCACGSSNDKKEQPQQTTAAEDLGGNWYRHYEGTIAGQPVSADIYHANDRLTGTYSYDKQGIILDIYEEKDSSKANTYFLNEDAPTEHENENAPENHAHWVISVSKEGISGKWISSDGKKQHDISLREGYDNSSYRFDILLLKDSEVALVSNYKIRASATYAISIPVPGIAGADRQLINSATFTHMGCRETDIDSCIRKKNEAYFSAYKEEIPTSLSEDESDRYNYELFNFFDVVYNKNGLLIMKQSHYSYTGGAHGIYGDTYACIDMTGKKVWQLNDVLQADRTAISALLETEVRKQFSIQATEALSDRLLTDTIKPTNNFYCTSTGIVFHYNPYEIASYADGEVDLYIPFSKLGSMLLPAFRQRMAIP